MESDGDQQTDPNVQTRTVQIRTNEESDENASTILPQQPGPSLAASCSGSGTGQGDFSAGASTASEPGDTRIRLKFLDETQRLVGTFLSKSVGEFKRY